MLINLVAADCIEEMADALERPLHVESSVARELRRDPRTGAEAQEMLSDLVQKRAIVLVTLSDQQLDHFLQLVGAPSPDDLGDGEAATIAYALENGFAAIDERKASRIIARDYPSLSVLTSLDLLCSDQAFTHFGEASVRDAVNKALKVGRMRVPHAWKSWLNDFNL